MAEMIRFQIVKLCSGSSDPWGVRNKAAMAKRDYLVEAAKQIRMALDSEVNEDYEAAFSYYKNGVDLLLNGVQRKWFGLSYKYLRHCETAGEFQEMCFQKSCDGIMRKWIKIGSHKPKVKQICLLSKHFHECGTFWVRILIPNKEKR